MLLARESTGWELGEEAGSLLTMMGGGCEDWMPHWGGSGRWEGGARCG
jgi:hypothetical protein